MAVGSRADWIRLGVGAVVAGQSMVFGLAVNLSPPDGPTRLILHAVLAAAAVIVFLLVGGPVVAEAARGAFARRVNVEQFFLLGMAGAFGASVHSTLTGQGGIYYEVVAVLLAIYTLGTLVGAKRREAALASAEAYRRGFATAVVRTCCGHEREVPVGDVGAGDTVVVRPGAGVPVDGVVSRGVGYVREAAVTGEAFPVVKRPGDTVTSGSHAVDATLEIEATAGGGSRALDRLVAAVREAQSRPSRIQQEADRLVGWFLPVVLVVAGLTFAGWTWHSGWVTGLFHALAVLLVACPCAMGLATPIGIWSALGAMAGRGLVCQSGEMVERLARCDTVVFDKTGTLGDEDLGVTDCVTAPDVDRAALEAAVAAVEQESDHPVARAFRRWARPGDGARACELLGPVRVEPGSGVAGTVIQDGRRGEIAIGPPELAGESARHAALRDQLLDTGDAGRGRRIVILRDGELAGLAVLRENLRETAAEAVRALGELGLAVHVMTGDSQANAADAAGIPGVATVRAGLGPEDKARAVRDLEAAGRRVCFVGDGINDSIAMSTAHAGIAMAGGSALAVSSAGAEIFGGDLRRVPEAIGISRDVLAAIRGNLRFAAVYNALGMAVAAAGLLNPVIAALIMLASSVTVTWRALRHAERIQSNDQDVMDGAGAVRAEAPPADRLPGSLGHAHPAPVSQ